MSERAHEANDAMDEVVTFLSDPASYPDVPGEVEIIETHAARVFLAGDNAYKIKKPVRLPFLDFSDVARRRAALAHELELNLPHAPEIYGSLLPIARDGMGTLTLGGDGTPVEWTLRMRRFDQSALLSHVVREKPLDLHLCRDIADMAARYHRDAPQAVAPNGSRIVRAVIDQLVRGFEDAQSQLADGAAEQFHERASREFVRQARLLESRARDGTVRRCHGDLHLGNIVVIAGMPVAFDALEFNEDLATIDVLYDLAFLLMDMDFAGRRPAANAVLSAYVAAAPLGNEIEGLAALPLFLSLRAAVRAIVGIERARQKPPEKEAADVSIARRYLAFANDLLAPSKPVLVAIGGLSGTGKSTLAAALAPRLGASPGALHLRSDVERKRYFGRTDEEKLEPEHYTEAVSDVIYGRLFDKARRSLSAGRSVVVDAVFSKPTERDAMAEIAARAGCRFAGLWLHAPASALVARVEERRGDASDADARVVEAQLARDAGNISWTKVDAKDTAADTLSQARSALSMAGITL